MTTAYDDDSVRGGLDNVCDDLATTIGGDHDGHHLPVPTVQALYAFLSDLRDMHDEQSIDVETWATLAGLCDALLAGRHPLEEGMGKPCDRPGCRAPHNWTGGRCLGNDVTPVADVTHHVGALRTALHGGGR